MIEIVYAEYDATHRGDFRFDIPEGLDYWLLLMTQTPTIFYVHDQAIPCPPNTVILYEPHQTILYESNDQRFTNDWIMFQTDERFISDSDLPFGKPLKIDNPPYLHSLFRLVVMEHQMNSRNKEPIVRNLLQLMIYKLLDSNESIRISPIIRDIHDLRKQIHINPEADWSLSAMADMLNISPGYLGASYKDAFGLSCIEDVILSRIDLAKTLLRAGSLSVTEIVTRCGYKSTEHFYRQFKRICGYTPRQYQLKQNIEHSDKDV